MLFHSSQSRKWLLNVVRTNDYVIELMTEWLIASQLEKNRLRSHLSLEVLFGKARWVKAITELGICVLPEMDPQFRPILWAKMGPHSGLAWQSTRMIWACPGPPFSLQTHTQSWPQPDHQRRTDSKGPFVHKTSPFYHSTRKVSSLWGISNWKIEKFKSFFKKLNDISLFFPPPRFIWRLMLHSCKTD